MNSENMKTLLGNARKILRKTGGCYLFYFIDEDRFTARGRISERIEFLLKEKKIIQVCFYTRVIKREYFVEDVCFIEDHLEDGDIRAVA